jgi:predicted phage terminase large subunit-like protein
MGALLELVRAHRSARDQVFVDGHDEEAIAAQSSYGWYDDNGVRQGGLIAFIRYFWDILEPDTPFIDGWPMWAVAEHLEAVTRGEIFRLVMNVPPGFAKSIMVNVFWPAWEWGPMGKSHFRYVTFSYSALLTERDNGRFRDLISSDEYQALYGSTVQLRNKTTMRVMNWNTGWKLASSVGGVGTGERGQRCIIDDPNNVKDAESETIRAETTRWFRESLSTRFGDISSGALVVIQQRVHQEDITGCILDLGLDYTHLMVPMRYDWSRQTDGNGDPVKTPVVGWSDPRYNADGPEHCDGMLAWEARFPSDAVERLKKELGPYAFAGQLQQSPAPRGGGIFQRSWWQLYEPENTRGPAQFPPFDYVVASLDSAFTSDTQNDPSALTIWGTFTASETSIAGGEIDPKTGRIWQAPGRRRIMLIHAWRKFLKLHGEPTPRRPNEIAQLGDDPRTARQREITWRQRVSGQWGIVEWTRYTCQRFKVHTLLVEGKASGHCVADELRRLYATDLLSVHLINPTKIGGDKIARAHSVVPMFAQGLIYAPDYDWAELVIDEMGVFPRGKHDDLTDSATQALIWLRTRGLLQTDAEQRMAEQAAVTPRPQLRNLYPV